MHSCIRVATLLVVELTVLLIARSVQILSIDLLACMKEGLADRLSFSVCGKLHDQAACDSCC